MPKVNLFALVGTDAATFEAAGFWEGLPPARKGKVPLGATSSGGPVLHDLDGAHLYVRGPRGSGRSELLRAVTLGLMLTHAPSDVSFVLLDGSYDHTFADFASAPHLVTTMERDELFTPSRLQQALRGELTRRTGGATGADLVIVVDQFDHIPVEWQDQLWSLAEYGRKAGVHLVLSSEAEAPSWMGRVVSLSEPGQASLDGVEFGPAFVSQPHEDSTLLRLAVTRMIGQGVRALDFYHPPLRSTPSVEELVEPDAAPLTAPIGLVDDPFGGAQPPLRIDLSALDGHAVVVGAHGSGKTTLLATIVQSLALHHSPAAIQFYGIDFAGGGLRPLVEIPHVRAVVSSVDGTLVWQLNNTFNDLLVKREKAFRQAGVTGIAEYRAHVRVSGPVDDEPADVVIVVDSWMGTSQFESLRWNLVDFVNRGADFGVHVVVTANRWHELAPEFHGAFAVRLELRLTDQSTSQVDVYARYDGPGHGTDGSGRKFLVPAPHRVTAWQAEALPKLRALPSEVGLASLTPDKRIPLGVAEGDGRTVYAAETQHFFVFGDSESGRSTAIRTYLNGVIAGHAAKDALFLVVDYRKSHLGVGGDHLIGYAPFARQLKDMLVDVKGSLEKRLHGEWSGPELFLVVDDYDLIPAHDNPLDELIGLVPQSKLIGLHVVVASRHHHKPNAFLNSFPADQTSVLMLNGSGGDAEPISGLTPAPYPAGRGLLSTPSARHVIQVAR